MLLPPPVSRSRGTSIFSSSSTRTSSRAGVTASRADILHLLLFFQSLLLLLFKNLQSWISFASNPELGSSKPFGLVDGLKKPLLLLWIPGSCNCKTPEETYNSLSKQAKNLQQPTGRARVQPWSAARVFQGIHPHPATVMEAARTSSRRMPDPRGGSGRPVLGVQGGHAFAMNS